MKQERVSVVRNNGVTIYGTVMDSKGKLGQYEVESDHIKSSGIVHSKYSDAELEMQRLIGSKNH